MKPAWCSNLLPFRNPRVHTRLLVAFVLINLQLSVQCFVDHCSSIYPFFFCHCLFFSDIRVLSILSSPHFVLYLVPRYFLFVLRVLPFTQSPVRGCRSRSTDHTLCLHHLLFGNACIKSFCHFIIYNNKPLLLLHPYMPSHLINLKNQTFIEHVKTVLCSSAIQLPSYQ